MLPGSTGDCSPPCESQRSPGACGKLREGLGVKAGADHGLAESSSMAMGLSAGPLQAGVL